MAWKILIRGALFMALAAGTYLVVFIVGLRMLLHGSGADPFPVLIETIAIPSGLDVAVTGVVALVVNVVPSSRLRVLPVWMVCAGLGLLRVYTAGLLLDSFAFGPGAYPQDVWAVTLSLYGTPLGLTVAFGVLVAGLLATLRRPPTPLGPIGAGGILCATKGASWR